MDREELFRLLHDEGVLPVLQIADEDKAERTAEAVMKGGATAAEMTFTNLNAGKIMKRITRAFPRLVLGAGSVTSAALAEEAFKAGARFIVCPGVNPETISWCIANNIPVIPGVATPSDVERGLAFGLDVFDFFPSEAMGGTKVLSAIESSFPGVRFLASGGITEDKLQPYAKTRNVLSVAGSWAAKSDLIESESWDEISERVRSALIAFQGFELAHIGINSNGEEDAAVIRDGFTRFGLAPRIFKHISFFMNDDIEIMRIRGRGEKGHICYRVNDISRTLYFLEKNGFTANWESAQYTPEGVVRLIYINEMIGGFAIHLQID